MMLKGMREANAAFAEGSMLSSPELSMHEEMLDQQWAIHMAEQGGIGLAPIIEGQLRGERTPATPVQGPVPLSGSLRRPAHPGYGAVDVPALHTQRESFKASAYDSRETFVAAVLPEIERGLQGVGISPHAVLAQSALETGWGRHVIHGPDGASSHNLFGIKAGRSWQGERVTVKTLEVIDGRPEVQSAEFRSYPNVRAAVEDYVRLLQSDERYQDVLESRDGDGFANAMQESGYATDPRYAHKIKAVIGSLRELVGA
jgi:flagellar protein FlgJ